MKRLAAIAVGCACVVAVPAAGRSAQSVSPLWHDLKPGPHRVGVRVMNLIDASATQRAPRIVRVAVWYPAEPGTADHPLLVGEYPGLVPDRVPDPALEQWHTARDRDSLSRQFFDAQAAVHQAELFRTPTMAVADAAATRGRFPLVLHSLGRNGGLYQHTILWEYLASHGFVVASVAQFGKDLANPGMDFTFADLSIQRADVERALEALGRLPNVDPARVGVMGHSSGAIVALWTAAAHSNVAAVVGLDGSVNRSEGKDMFIRGLAGRPIAAPFLNICRWPHDEYVDYTSRHVRGQLARIGYTRAVHFDFQNWPAYLALMNSHEPASDKIRTVAEARQVFESTAVFARLFLEAQLTGNTAAGDTVTSNQRVAELSANLATLAVRPPQSK
jgi:pimeloyl-ACP methyl ester carboxylesterase